MPIATHTLTGDFNSIIGEVSKVVATVHTNSEDGGWVNETDLKITLGGAKIPVAADGTFTVTLPTSTGTGLQYEVRVNYVDPALVQAGFGKQSWRSGWFDLTANSNLAERALNSSLNITPSLASTLDARIDALEADTGVGDALADLIEQVNGYNDLGNVSGAVTINPVGTQVLTATAATTLTIGSGTNGESFTIMVRAGGDYITWPVSVGFDHGEPTGDKITVTLIRVRGAWVDPAGSTSGGAEIPPVDDPPTQPGTVTVDPTADGYNLTWVASTVASGYEVQLDGGSWVDSGSDTAHTYTGLTAGSSHSGAVRAYNSLGERSTSRAWGPASVDTMTLHDLILSMDPEVYLRMTEGSLQDYSRIPGTWAAVSGKTLPNFTGPALTPGDTSSAHFVAGSQINRPYGGLLEGATSFTMVAVGGAPPSGVAAGGAGLHYGDQVINGYNWWAESYQPHLAGGVHTWFSTWDPATQTESPTNVYRWFEGNSSRFAISGFGKTAPLAAPGSPNDLRIHGNQHGGSEVDSGYYGYVAIFKNVVLTQEQRTAIATAAGTIDNPAGGA